MYSTASSTLKILSASASGISIANSSSMAITTSTESKESRPRSSENLADGVTLVASTLSKFFTTVMIRSDASDASRKVCKRVREELCFCVYFCVVEEFCEFHFHL